MCESLGKLLHPTKDFYGCHSQALVEGKPIAASMRGKAYRDEDRVQSGAILSSAALRMLMAPELAGRSQEIQLSALRINFLVLRLPGSALGAAVPGEQIPGSEACMSSEVRGGGGVESQGVLASRVERGQSREQPACWS